MADLVVFDELASPQKVLQHLKSVNTPDYSARTDVVINPDLSALDGIVPFKYWKHSGGNIVEFSQAEKDAQDAAEAAAQTTANRNSATNEVDAVSGEGVRNRALIELFNKRDNYIINRLIELQTDLQAIKATSGGADNIRNAISASYLATAIRTKADAVQSFKDDINAGTQDNP